MNEQIFSELFDPIHNTEIIYPNFLKKIPEQWIPFVINFFNHLSKTGLLEQFCGLHDDSQNFILFHSTKFSYLESIADDEKLKAFPELGKEIARIYGTVSPSLAIWHGENNGPQDTNRKAQGDTDTHKQETTELLVLILPKEWMEQQASISEPRALPQWIKDSKGITGENDTRYEAFKEDLVSEVNAITHQREVSDFGVLLPVDSIPCEYIYVVDLRSKRIVPLKDYV